MDEDLLLTTLTNLGFDKAGEYNLGLDAVNNIRVLIKYLKMDQKNCKFRIQIGKSNIWAKDLIPILVEHNENKEIFPLVILLLMNLSRPTTDVFKVMFFI